MKKDIRIGERTYLPERLVTETVAFLAMRGGGKSNAAVVLAEEMYRLGLQWVAIDPKGDWWGIRSAADGKGTGLAVPVFGGRHGDIPLEASAGALMASLVVDRDLTCVLDVSLFSKAEQIRFVTDFAETLFRGVQGAPRPVHLFLEEAEEFLPQRVDARSARMVGAYSKISKQGRTLGLGVSLITQRSASLNKDALSQTDTLVLFRTTSPHDRKAVVAWAEYHAEAPDIASSLSELAAGESWILSPGFLGKIQRVTWRRRTTFDSGATPVVGKRRAAPVRLADIDLDEIKERMAETIEAAARDDPKVLRKQITDLRRELNAAEVQVVEVEKVVTVPVIPEDFIGRIEKLAAQAQEVEGDANSLLDRAATIATEASDLFQEALDRSAGQSGEVADRTRAEKRTVVGKQVKPRELPTAAVVPAFTPGDPTDITVGKSERAVLRVLSRYPDGMNRRRLAALAGYSPKKSTIRNALSTLRTAGFIGHGDPVVPTPAGLAFIADDTTPLPSGDDLLAYWMDEVGAAENRVLRVLIDLYPALSTKDEVARLTGDDPAKSTIRNAISRLRTLGLADPSGYRADDDFMEAIGRR